jgi:hypothetical protein
MAAPSATARQTPVGKKLENGKTIKITFSLDPDVSIWEINITPGGTDGGDPIDTTTQWNTRRRTKSPRNLINGTDGSGTAAYDPQCQAQLDAMVNVPQTITYLYWDGSTEARFGYLRSWAKNEMSEGNMPTMNFVIVHTDYDTVNDVEADPVVTSVAGT